MRYVKRRDPNGEIRRIAVVDGTPRGVIPKTQKREPFKAEWVRLPQRWIGSAERQR